MTRITEPGGDRRHALGLDGETAAESWLARKGWRILARRWRARCGEIDLIADDPDDVLVFVEVKTRRREDHGTPGEAVGAVKRRRLARAAALYLHVTGSHERVCRFDVVEVVSAPGGGIEVRHVEDAFRLGPRGF